MKRNGSSHRRRNLGTAIGCCHFVLSYLTLLQMVEEVMNPTGPSLSIWLVAYLVLLFPINLLQPYGLVDLFYLFSPVTIVLVALTSALWGWVGARLLVRKV